MDGRELVRFNLEQVNAAAGGQCRQGGVGTREGRGDDAYGEGEDDPGGKCARRYQVGEEFVARGR